MAKKIGPKIPKDIFDTCDKNYEIDFPRKYYYENISNGAITFNPEILEIVNVPKDKPVLIS